MILILKPATLSVLVNTCKDAIGLMTRSASTISPQPRDLSYAYELIGECNLKKGNRQEALIYYEKALATDGNNQNAKGMVTQLLTH
jgi:tetratricopeptide (TPR) repeat protein